MFHRKMWRCISIKFYNLAPCSVTVLPATLWHNFCCFHLDITFYWEMCCLANWKTIACLYSFVPDLSFSIVSAARSGLTIQTSFSIEWLIIHLMTITHRALSWSNRSVRTCTHGFQRMNATLQLCTARLAKAVRVSWPAVICYTVTSSKQPKMLSISMVRNGPPI